MQDMIDRIQTILDGEVKRADDLESEGVRLHVSEKSLNRQLQLRFEHSQGVENLKYQLDGSVAKECPAQNSIEPLREYPLSIRFYVDKYCQSFPVLY